MRVSRTLTLGFTVLELIATLSIVGVLAGGAILALGDLRQPADEGASEVVSFIKSVRARALVSVKAYKIAPTSSTQLGASSATSCSSATFTTDSSLSLKLPKNSFLTTTNWSVCYTSRGIAEANSSFSVSDGSHSNSIQVALGGGVQVQ